MYIKNGICYGELELGITITDAKPLDWGIVLVTFYAMSYPYDSETL